MNLQENVQIATIPQERIINSNQNTILVEHL